jgi:hypothetical protein
MPLLLARGRFIPYSEVEARFFAIAQNDSYLLVILNGANATLRISNKNKRMSDQIISTSVLGFK